MKLKRHLSLRKQSMEWRPNLKACTLDKLELIYIACCKLNFEEGKLATKEEFARRGKDIHMENEKVNENMTKKQLYNQIMEKVAIVVKNALNESLYSINMLQSIIDCEMAYDDAWAYLKNNAKESSVEAMNEYDKCIMNAENNDLKVAELDNDYLEYIESICAKIVGSHNIYIMDAINRAYNYKAAPYDKYKNPLANTLENFKSDLVIAMAEYILAEF